MQSQMIMLVHQAAFDLDADKLSPKFAVTYNINEDLSTYAQYSQGFRAPAYYEVNANFSNPMRGYTLNQILT